MSTKVMDLPFSYVMKLYRAKCDAENKGDRFKIASLKAQYPELFSVEFHDFIEMTKAVAADLDEKYDEKFTSMFEPGFKNREYEH